MVSTSLYVLLAFLAGAGASLAGVWMGGLVRRESALEVENRHLAEEIARLRAASMLADGRVKLLEEVRDRLEQELDRTKKEEAARGEVYVPPDEDGGTLGSGLEEIIGRQPDPGPLGDAVLAGHARFVEQMSRLSNPSTGENP